jgi:hypothetical protein
MCCTGASFLGSTFLQTSSKHLTNLCVHATRPGFPPPPPIPMQSELCALALSPLLPHRSCPASRMITRATCEHGEGWWERKGRKRGRVWREREEESGREKRGGIRGRKSGVVDPGPQDCPHLLFPITPHHPPSNKLSHKHAHSLSITHTFTHTHTLSLSYNHHRASRWSLGCCLYEMMTLKHAFDASDLTSLVRGGWKGRGGGMWV